MGNVTVADNIYNKRNFMARWLLRRDFDSGLKYGRIKDVDGGYLVESKKGLVFVRDFVILAYGRGISIPEFQEAHRFEHDGEVHLLYTRDSQKNSGECRIRTLGVLVIDIRRGILQNKHLDDLVYRKEPPKLVLVVEKRAGSGNIRARRYNPVSRKLSR